MLLSHVKQEYEDVRLSNEEFTKMKTEGKLEFGQVPAVEWDGVMYTQTHAILRAIGHNNGLYSTDPITMWKIDSIIDATGDLLSAYYTAAFNPVEETKKELLEKFFSVTFPTYLERLENRLKKNSSQKHIVGDNMTIADFVLAGVAYSRFLNEANPNKATELAIVEKNPVALAYFKSLGEELKEHLEKRKPSAW